MAFAADADWSNPEAVAKYRADRMDYHLRNENGAQELVNKMSAKGSEPTDIAKAVNEYRNQSRINAYKNNSGEITNLAGYNNAVKRAKLNSYENLILSGKTPEEIIESATRGNPAMDACCGLHGSW